MAEFKKSIENFKAALAGGGVRPSMFQVELRFPNSVVDSTAGVDEQGIFMINASQLPASTVGVIDVPFRGRKFKVSGDRTFAPWTITVTNDTTFNIRKGLEKWSELIQNHNFVLGANNTDVYQTDAIVRQLDRDGNQLRVYQFNGIWPTSLSEMALDMNETDTVQTYTCEFAVQFWSAAGKKAEDADFRSNPVADVTNNKTRIQS